jgi:hypothetical protein
VVDAVKLTEPPAQMVGDAGDMVEFANGLTVTVTGTVFVQPAVLVPVTEYVVVAVGEAVVVAVLVGLSPAVGVQE